MYTRENTLAATLDTINKGIRYTAGQMDYADKLMREKAQSDLFYQEAQFTKDTQDFLRGLQQKGSYGTFQEELDNYLTKKGNALQKAAPNAYTARLYDQMLVSQRNQLQNTVENMKVKMQYNEMLVKNESAAEMNRSSMQGQAAIDVNSKIYNSELANGAATFEQAHAKMLKDATENATKDVYNNASNLMESIFQKGGNFSDVKKYIEDYTANNDYSFKMLDNTHANPEGFKLAQETGEGWITFNGEVDKKAISDGVAKKLQAQWDAKIEEEHNKNMGTITQWEVEMFRLPPSEQIAYAENALMKIERDFGGNKLSPSQRDHAANIFKAYTKGTASKGKGKDFEKVMGDFIETNQDYFIQIVNDGVISGYEARKLFEDKVLEKYQTLKADPKLMMKDLKQDFPEVMGFLDALKKAAPPEIKALITKQENDFKEALKDIKLDKDNEYIAKFTNLLWDDLLALKYSDAGGIEYVKDQLETERKALKGTKLDILRNNFKSGNTKFQDGIIFTEEKNLAEFLYTAEQHPQLIMSDENGRVGPSVFANGGEVFSMAETAQRKLLEQMTGIPEDEWISNYETETRVTKNGTVIKNPYDVAAVQIFSPDQGKTQYKVRSYDKRNLTVLKSEDGGNTWRKLETEKQASQRIERQNKQYFRDEARSVAENIDMHTLREAGLYSQEWLKNVSKKNYNWLTNQIIVMVNQYNSNNIDPSLKDTLKRQLEALGYKLY